MKRTKNSNDKKADAVLVSDLHLTDSTPVSRIDDYIKAQANKLAFLQALSIKNDNCPILCAGDIFDNWKASPWLCSWAYYHLPVNMITVPGNHDLPMHSLAYYNKSALCLLEEVSGLQVLEKDRIVHNYIHITGAAFNTLNEIEDSYKKRDKGTRRKVLILHELVWPDKRPGWGKTDDYSAQEILSKYGPYFDLILTGDNHEFFIRRDEKNNCLLVNPGSMMRITADQADYEPKCCLYYAEENEVKEIKFPIEREVHNRDHINKKKEKDERITAYIERMNQNWEIGLSFKNNLQTFFTKNQVPQKVREIIWLHLEAEKI